MVRVNLKYRIAPSESVPGNGTDLFMIPFLRTHPTQEGMPCCERNNRRAVIDNLHADAPDFPTSAFTKRFCTII